jgi:ubiquinone biosynthesis protein
MLKKKHLPTPLADPSERPPVAIVELRKLRFRIPAIVLDLIRFLLSVAWLALTRKLTKATFAVRLRVFLEKMGFLWIKAGQLLSLRSDLLPREICTELSNLQYQAFGFPPAIARQTIEAELGGPIETIFDEFEEHPFAAASISQVHKARLREEQAWVAVKVQRPDIQWVFSKDMGLLRILVKILNWFKIWPFMRWDEGMWEITEIMTEETDYRYEASNLRRLKKILRKHQVYVPKVFQRFSTQRVLTMEFIAAPLMTEYLAARDRRPEETAAWLRENKIKPRKLGRRLFLSLMRQLFEEELFHADMHPGNIMLLRNSRFALIDFGTAGHLEYEWLEKYLQSMKALTERNYAKAADLFLYLCPSLPAIDLAPAKEKMIRVFRAWAERAALKSLPYEEKSISYMALELTKVWLEYGIMMSWSFVKMDRSWSTLDASLTSLIPKDNYNKLFEEYFSQRNLRRSRECMKLKNIADFVSALPDVILEYRLYISNLMRRVSLVIEATRTKMSYVFELCSRGASWAAAIAGLYLTYHFLQPKADRAPMIDALSEPLRVHVTDFVEWLVPDFIDHGKSLLGDRWWILVILVDLYVFLRMRKIVKRMMQNDVVRNNSNQIL